MKSIATRFLMSVAALAVTFVALDMYLSYSDAERRLAEQMDRQAALGLAFDLAIRSYVAEEIRPAMEERTAPGEFIPETMSTSFVARSVFEKVRKEFPDYLIKFSSDDPRNPANQAGVDELRMIRYFNDHPKIDHWSGEIELNGRPHFAHFGARRMKERCLRCHGRPEDAPTSLVQRYGETAGFARPVGEVIALDTVAIPMDKTQGALIAGTLSRSALMAGGIALLALMSAVLFRVIVARRLAAMEAHFGRLAAQPETAPITSMEVRGHDEISSLARSFNVLADKVHAAQASLEQQVRDRTADLREANEVLQREVNDRKRAEQASQQARDKAQASAERATRAMVDMERMNAAMTGREERILAMKQEVNDLLAELGQARKYEHV